MTLRILLLSPLIIPRMVCAQNTEKTITRAQALIEDHKYKSAFQALDSADPGNINVEATLLKTDIILDYFVLSIMHQMFALKDIGKEEDILAYRGKENTAEMINFPVNEILDTLLKQHPEECRLHRQLAKYYSRVRTIYGSNWIYPEKKLRFLVDTHSGKAISGNCADAHTYFEAGVVKLEAENMEAAIPLLQTAIRLDTKYPAAHYNLAYAYYMTGAYQLAADEAAIAWTEYQNTAFKSDAALLASAAYRELKNLKEAITWSDHCLAANPGSETCQLEAVSLRMENGDMHPVEATRNIMTSNHVRAEVLVELNSLFINHEAETFLAEQYESVLKKSCKELSEQCGWLHYGLALLIKSKDKSGARKHLLKAKEHLGTVYKETAGVFQQISKLIEECGGE